MIATKVNLCCKLELTRIYFASSKTVKYKHDLSFGIGRDRLIIYIKRMIATKENLLGKLELTRIYVVSSKTVKYIHDLITVGL